MTRAPGRLAALLAAWCVAPAAWADDPAAAGGSPAQPSAPVARAAPARVDFARPGCSPLAFDEPSFIALLRIELATDGVAEVAVHAPFAAGPSAADGRALAVLSLVDACAADGTLSLAIDDAATSKRVERVVELGPVPARARARVLALAAAELLRASWAELVLPQAPAPRITVPAELREATGARLRRATERTEPAPRRAATPDPSERVLVVAAPEARFFFREHLGLFGARIGPSIPLGRRAPLRLRLHVGSAFGAGAVDDERFDAWLVTSGVGVAGGGHSRTAALEIGPHLELGWGWRRPRTQPGSAAASSDGVVAAVSIVASGRVHLGGAWWSVADLELGQAVASDDGGVARTGGTTAGARVGFALAP